MKYKLCPACQTKNAPSSLFCENCDLDLSTVRLSDESAEVPGPEERAARSEEGSNEPVLVRICDCGAVNPAQARKCQECGEDLSDVAPTPASGMVEGQEPDERWADAPEVRYCLSSIPDGTLFQVPCGTVLLGREHTLRELLGSKRYVSRIHAKLTAENGELFIENLSTTNFTYVNNIRIPQGRVKLKLNDEIGLGGIALNGSRQTEAAYFLVGLAL